MDKKVFKIEDYIKDLSPELQEKARACKNMDELMELAGEEGVELSDEALGNVAGGCSSSSTPCNHSGCQGQITAATRVGAGRMAGESKWKVTQVKCTSCWAIVNATKTCYQLCNDQESIYMKSVPMSDVI